MKCKHQKINYELNNPPKSKKNLTSRLRIPQYTPNKGGNKRNTKKKSKKNKRKYKRKTKKQ